MNSRILAGVSGLIILALGIAGLLYPDTVMANLGLAVAKEGVPAAVLGEIRATYGGLFIVMGAYTLLSALDPIANRGRLTFIALMWLGAALGRLFGTTVDGSPGVFGWLAVTFEVLISMMLIAAAWRPSDSSRQSAATPPPAASVPPAPMAAPHADQSSSV